MWLKAVDVNTVSKQQIEFIFYDEWRQKAKQFELEVTI